jgi:hypothetical protein
LTVQIDDGRSTDAIIRYSPIRFSAKVPAGSDSNTYTIDFGDGSSQTGAVAVHRCQKQGSLTSRLTVVDSFGQSSTATAKFSCYGLVHYESPDYSVVYGWVAGTPSPLNPQGRLIRLGFESQSGANFSGFYTYYTNADARGQHFTGTLTGDRDIHIVLDDGTVEFTGQFMPKVLLLRGKGGVYDGLTVTFNKYDPF